jgi:hypothetical protein
MHLLRNSEGNNFKNVQTLLSVNINFIVNVILFRVTDVNDNAPAFVGAPYYLNVSEQR